MTEAPTASASNAERPWASTTSYSPSSSSGVEVSLPTPVPTTSRWTLSCSAAFLASMT
ncbi:MAG: hypothetical protein R2754_16040 [Microthrixaceae bacterium]